MVVRTPDPLWQRLHFRNDRFLAPSVRLVTLTAENILDIGPLKFLAAYVNPVCAERPPERL
jgi:hypothetical protein